jgi:hypothetical protein
LEIENHLKAKVRDFDKKKVSFFIVLRCKFLFRPPLPKERERKREEKHMNPDLFCLLFNLIGLQADNYSKNDQEWNRRVASIPFSA